MGDHFVLLVDRLLTESTLAAAIESRNSLTQIDEVDYSPRKDSEASLLSPGKLVECRICQDEDFDSRMETPCSCRGSLKYAHRKCIQRWCNEKGDIICEICHQQFEPGYIAPPPIFRLGALPMTLRGNWQISRRDANNSRIITMVSTDQDGEDDEFEASTSRNILCCRSVAIIFIVLLVLRHTLPVIVSHAGNYSFPLVMLLMLRIIGIILPVCIILKALTSILQRRNQQQSHQANVYISSSSDEESGRLNLHQSHVVGVVQ